MPSVTSNGLTLEYDSRGAGEPVLFIMGLGAQLVAWPEDFVDLFVRRGYRVIRFDNRDIGLSSKTDYTPPSRTQLRIAAGTTRRPLAWDGYTLADMADDAAGLIDALDLGPTHIVGASMGGMIAQEFAINHPDKVASLCSIMSNTGDRKYGRIAPSVASKWMRMAEPTPQTAVETSLTIGRLISGPHFDEDRYRATAELALSRNFDPVGVQRQTAAIAASPNRTERLGSVSVPTLVIHGLGDKLVRPSGGTATAKAINGSRLLAFADMAHDLPEPRWAEMCDAMVTNFRRVGTATDPTADAMADRREALRELIATVDAEDGPVDPELLAWADSLLNRHK